MSTPNLGFKKRGLRMERLSRIPPNKRCQDCAGFGFVYRCNAAETEISDPKCGTCKGTGRRAA